MRLDRFIALVNIILGDKRPDLPNLNERQISDLINISQLKHFKRKIGLPEMYQPGMPYPNQVLEVTQKIKEDLRPFLVSRTSTSGGSITVSSIGLADIPTNCAYISTLGFNYPKNIGIGKSTATFRNVELVTDTQWNDRMSSNVIFPDKSYPIANIMGDKIRFYPKNLKKVDMIYYRYPSDVVYATKLSGKVIFTSVYDEQNSVEFEWDDVNQMDILYLLLSDMGLAVDKGQILQYSESVKMKGI